MLNKQTIKQHVSIEQVARYYGMQIDNWGKLLVSFFTLTKNPSMKINGRKKWQGTLFRVW